MADTRREFLLSAGASRASGVLVPFGRDSPGFGGLTTGAGHRLLTLAKGRSPGMVIGKGGGVLKEVGTRVREQLPPGAYLELRVKVDQDWQRRPERVERLGY